ncbi:Uncharacterized protein HZ326_26734 [Fusarium oxysporum f. sp. albedinis]|nr:Uncharacterized protein HZ326_26734 [Fusarium oxysporum f. sp. albedinis]
MLPPVLLPAPQGFPTLTERGIGGLTPLVCQNDRSIPITEFLPSIYCASSSGSAALNSSSSNFNARIRLFNWIT